MSRGSERRGGFSAQGERSESRSFEVKGETKSAPNEKAGLFKNPRLAAVSSGFIMNKALLSKNVKKSDNGLMSVEERQRLASQQIGMFTAVSGKPFDSINKELLDNQVLYNKEVVTKMYEGMPLEYGKPKLVIDRKRKYYLPILKHPLPLSMHKVDHEHNLKRVLACKPSKQAIAAVALKDAWTLEEVYMRGAAIDIPDKNGFTPLHIAATLNCIEVMMVLFHIGVDVNCETLQGNTPLYLSISSKAKQCELLLKEQGGLLNAPGSSVGAAPGANALDQYIPESRHGGSVIKLVNEAIAMPNEHTYF